MCGNEGAIGISQNLKIHSNLQKCRGVLIYEVIAHKLLEGKTVLFIGLGCDVGALYQWLKNKDIDITNLFTVDLICHGVTYPAAQEAFIEELEQKYGGKVVKFTSRDKRKGWRSPSIRVDFSNGKTYSKLLYETDFGYAFRVYTRESCYHCRFKGSNHRADITIGDYWGMSAGQKGFHKNGVSVLLSRSDKGEQLIQKLEQNRFLLEEGDAKHMIKNNRMFETSVSKFSYRDTFEKDFKEKGLHQAVIRSEGYRVYRKSALKNRLLRMIGEK